MLRQADPVARDPFELSSNHEIVERLFNEAKAAATSTTPESSRSTTSVGTSTPQLMPR
jgi:hypothetical protein